MFIAALIPKHVTRFFLPDLIAVQCINQVKGKIGMQVKAVVGIVKLILYQITVMQGSDGLCIGICPGSYTPFIWIQCAIKSNNSFRNGPVGYLPGSIPSTVHGGAGKTKPGIL